MVEPSEDRPRLWPAWTPNIPDSLPELARYVAVDALDDAQFGPDPSAGESAEPTPERHMLELLYARLARQPIDFWRERWHPGEGQLIRHPWLLVNGRSGTCLDFATTYASMCLAASIPPLLALTEHDGVRHALVVATPARDVPLTRPYDAVSGISEVSDAAAFARELEDGTLVAVDHWRGVGEAPLPFAAACTSGTQYLREVAEGGGSVWLVDVAWLQSNGHPPLEPPATRAPVRRFIPGGRSAFDRYESHAALFAELEHASGTVVLLGEPGTGKSTLARELAYRARFGAGWVLTASEPQALVNSLNQAERNERPAAVEASEQLDREGYAAAALARLNEAEDEWVVVLDNADGDPGKLTAWLPRPNHGRPAGVRQLVVITTTNREWMKRHELDLRRLPPVSAAEAGSFLPGPELVPLAEGRPLLFDAFARLAETTTWSGAEIAAHQLTEGAVERELRGPACLWAAVRQAKGVGEAELAAAVYGAFLPPDDQPLTVHAALHGAPDAVMTLAALGLFDADDDGQAVRLHRLFGRAIRAGLEPGADQALRDRAVTRIATGEASFDLLDAQGDLRTVLNLDQELTRLDKVASAPDHALGVAMHGVARLLELHGHTRLSGERYERAERHLEDDPVRRAQGLHGRARTVNQHHAKEEPLLRDALAWAMQAQAVLAASEDPGSADRCLAMQGLLRQKLASFPREGETELGLLEDALGVIEEAHRRRTERLDPDAPELARSHFNLAGIRIRLAKAEPARARLHLQQAWDVYVAVEQTRRRIYGRDRHPHIAACVIGRGYVDYNRALLLPASRVERSRLLREATDATMDALRMRMAQDGSVDQDEVVKVTRFLAKVALARDAAVEAGAAPSAESFEKRFGGRVRKAHAEIGDARLVLASIPDLPAVPADAAEAADGWVRSRALAELVTAYDPQAEPPYQGDLPELLEWLEAFSLRWDTRQGKERNLVTAQEPPAELAALVRRTALALGMVGTTAPPADEYDHVLILGGLVRACLARPLHAAGLVEAGVRARTITALGAFRPLRGDELELAERFGHGGLTDEFDAMHAGVRAAFELGAPVSEQGVRSEAVGASWAVVEYGGPARVRVVGAPSPEPGRRANTGDTYKWFAEHVAALSAGERVLLVTSDIYARYQHADALRMLALPYGVEVEAVGLRPGDADPRLAQEFTPVSYLQEIRSTIRALRALDAAITAR